jgi:CO/xanthine dehydrogenase Mo-binding subunit
MKSRTAVTAEYIHNLRLPGMLYGKICRSTVPHGRIRRIDTGAAAAIAGVHRIVTAADIPASHGKT